MGGYRAAGKSVEIMNLVTHQWRTWTGPSLPSPFHSVQPIIHSDAIFLINEGDGKIVKILDDTEWQEVGRLGKLGKSLLHYHTIVTADIY